MTEVGSAASAGDPVPDGRIALELADPGVQVPAIPGQSYLKDRDGVPISTLFSQSQGELINRWITGPLRLHAVFQPNLSNPLVKPVLDPLALDDITLTFQGSLHGTDARNLPDDHPLEWQEGE